MNEYNLGVAILICFTAVAITIVLKLRFDQMSTLLSSKYVLVLFSGSMVVLLLILQFFDDLNQKLEAVSLLKVFIGLLTGSVASLSATNADTKKDSTSMTAIGSDIQLAGRDITNVKTMLGDLKEVTNSVINQINTIEKKISDFNFENSEPVVQQMGFQATVIIPQHKRLSRSDSAQETLIGMPPVGNDKMVREWLNKRQKYCLSIPEVIEEIQQTVERLKQDKWIVKEIFFDLSFEEVNILFGCCQHMSISELLKNETPEN